MVLGRQAVYCTVINNTQIMTNTEKDLVDVLKYHIAVDQFGTRRYSNAAGQLHREEGPAVITAQGAVFWYQCGELHRVGGPAIEWPDGCKEWFQNGVLQREDGPVVLRSYGREEW